MVLGAMGVDAGPVMYVERQCFFPVHFLLGVLVKTHTTFPRDATTFDVSRFARALVFRARAFIMKRSNVTQ